MSQIAITIGDVAGTAELDDALGATGVFLDALPIEAVLTHGCWSGMTGEFSIDAAGGPSDPRVIGLAPGSIALDPEHRLVLISYGNAESRTALGPHYVIRLGEFRDHRAELLAMLGRMHNEGDKTIVIRRDAAAGQSRSS